MALLSSESSEAIVRTAERLSVRPSAPATGALNATALREAMSWRKAIATVEVRIVGVGLDWRWPWLMLASAGSPSFTGLQKGKKSRKRKGKKRIGKKGGDARARTRTSVPEGSSVCYSCEISTVRA